MYQPPPGPPPGRSSATDYKPPPGPPPGKGIAPNEPPPPYHDWTVIPDTTLLPPPPGMLHKYSSAANATEEESDRAAAWCHAYPLWQPRQLSWEQLNAIHNQDHTLVRPPSFNGDIVPASPLAGSWKCHSYAGCKDSLLQTALPIYSSLADSPLLTKRPKVIYFEIKILGLGRQTAPSSKISHNPFSRHHHHQQQPSGDDGEAGVAIGFFAPPYPSFRLPGWQRGSLAVHSDDGRRYVNNTDGGLDFTTPFKVGETLGIGMAFKIPSKPPAYGEQGGAKPEVDVFFTREGKKVGGWDLYEERDVNSDVMGVRGLEGDMDLFPAMGVFGACEVEVRFKEGEWLYRPKVF